MYAYIIRRVIILIPLILLVSIISFTVIQAPPGSYVESYVQNLQNSGLQIDQSEIDMLMKRYYLDKSVIQQYLIWIQRIIFHFDFGLSFYYNRPVKEILLERIPRTMAISLSAILLQWVIAIPIGVYSAVKQYSAFDYIFTFVGFIGLSIPAFMFAIVIVFFIFRNTGFMITGLFSPAYREAAWSFARFLDMLRNVSVPLIVLGSAGAAALIRILRGSLLDELKRQYVVTARAKGLKETKLLFKYPVRLAINPLVSTIGWLLPAMVGGEVVVSQVLNMPTTGPVLIQAIMTEDMYLAGGILFILSSLTIIGTLVSDILLAVLDPRIRYG